MMVSIEVATETGLPLVQPMLAAAGRRALGWASPGPWGKGGAAGLAATRSLGLGGMRFMCEKAGSEEGAQGEKPPAAGQPPVSATPAWGGSGQSFRQQRPLSFSPARAGSWNQGSLAQRSAARSAAPGGPGGQGWDVRPEGAPVPEDYDPALLKKLGIDKVPAWRIAMVLRDENTTLEQIEILWDCKFHLIPNEPGEEVEFDFNQPGMEGQPTLVTKKTSPNEWSPDKATQLLPRRKFFPGQEYEPQDLSPNTPVDWGKLKRDVQPKGCPLGGKKGPKVDWTDAGNLSRYLTEGGNIKPRRATKVCAKKQKELTKAIARARIMGLLARTSRVQPTPYYQNTSSHDRAGATYRSRS